MGANERSTFFRRLEEFQDERGEDSGPPLFAKKAVDTFKLWNAVQEAGGFHMVTNNKGWARIGRLFDPPRTMTDLSFRIKKIYEMHLLPFEKVVDDGRFPDVYQPVRQIPAQQPSMSRAGRTSTKRASNSRATPTPSQRPKRARRETRQHGADESLVGKVVKIYIPGENRFTRANVESYEKDMRMHRIKFEDGGSELLDLAEQEWLFDGPDNGLDLERLNELRNEAYALDDEEAFGNESEYEDLAPPKPHDSLPKDCVEDRIHDDRGYKVYYTSDGRGYEIFCLVPSLELEHIRVKAWETGKLLVRHVGQAKGDSSLAYRIRLPTGIVATETQAIITLHQQLYVRVPMFLAPDTRLGIAKSGAIPQGESAVQAVTSETLEQEVKTPPDDEAAISPDRSNAISPEKVAPPPQNPQGNIQQQPVQPPQAVVNGQPNVNPGALNGRQQVPAQGPYAHGAPPQMARPSTISHLNPNYAPQLNPAPQAHPTHQQQYMSSAPQQVPQMNPGLQMNPMHPAAGQHMQHNIPPAQIQQFNPGQPSNPAPQFNAGQQQRFNPVAYSQALGHMGPASHSMPLHPPGLSGPQANGSAPQPAPLPYRPPNGAFADQRPPAPSSDSRPNYMHFTHT